MSETKTTSTRRAFFARGSAVLGAGVATTVGAAALARTAPVSEGVAPTDAQVSALREQLDAAEDREAIRQLHLSFTTLLEQERYEAAAALFAEEAHLDLSGESARGQSAIAQLFESEYRHQSAAVIHRSYRQSASRQHDAVMLSEDRSRAEATFHVEAELCAPLQGDCTAAQMARLQGNVADRRWEAGRFEAKYLKTRGQWKIASLTYLAS